jgi:hypothetical protein
MSMLTPRLSPTRQLLLFLVFAFSIFGTNSFLQAEETVQLVSSPKTRTIVADFLMIDGGLYIVRGERGEIQIEVTPDTKISEKFTFGDRIKAVLFPNDVAQSITRAAPDEPVGITSNDVPEAPPLPPVTETSQPAETAPPQVTQTPNVRVIIADLLMVDGSFYIVRSEYGEIQIEITPKTALSEDFQFGDKIKARVTSTDKALSVVRAGKDEPTGVQEETAPIPSSAPTPPVPSTPTITPTPPKQETPEPTAPEIPSTRIIVADVLMVDGDFYIVRGERGEIRIEVTPNTTVSESFDYGDRIKAEVLPNDQALKIERASPNDPVGITTP